MKAASTSSNWSGVSAKWSRISQRNSKQAQRNSRWAFLSANAMPRPMAWYDFVVFPASKAWRKLISEHLPPFPNETDTSREPAPEGVGGAQDGNKRRLGRQQTALRTATNGAQYNIGGTCGSKAPNVSKAPKGRPIRIARPFRAGTSAAPGSLVFDSHHGCRTNDGLAQGRTQRPDRHANAHSTLR
jgi:hypothetical protein